MADTGEDREIKQRMNAHQKEVVREMKALVQTTTVRSAKRQTTSRGTKATENKITDQSRLGRSSSRSETWRRQ
jgi:hypothetical protein